MHVSSNGSSGSYDRWKRGVGVDLRRDLRLGVRSPEPVSNDVRRIAGVKPVDPKSSSCNNRGPGSENRTLFLDFLGVTDTVFCCWLRPASSGTAAKLCLVRRETGDWLLGFERELFRFLPERVMSMLERGVYWNN